MCKTYVKKCVKSYVKFDIGSAVGKPLAVKKPQEWFYLGTLSGTRSQKRNQAQQSSKYAVIAMISTVSAVAYICFTATSSIGVSVLSTQNQVFMKLPVLLLQQHVLPMISMRDTKNDS